MTKRDKETLFGLLILLGCVLYSSGFSAGLDFLKIIADAVALAASIFSQIAFKFRNELGITDWLWTRGIYGAIAVAAALLTGYAFTRKEKNKLLGIIGFVVSLISTIFTFSKSK